MNRWCHALYHGTIPRTRKFWDSFGASVCVPVQAIHSWLSLDFYLKCKIRIEQEIRLPVTDLVQ